MISIRDLLAESHTDLIKANKFNGRFHKTFLSNRINPLGYWFCDIFGSIDCICFFLKCLSSKFIGVRFQKEKIAGCQAE